jgi:hypothetical protein
LHRTVSDFLNEPGVRQVIERETLQFNSEIYERLAASILYSFKAWRFFHLKSPYEWKIFIGEVRAFLIYCERCEPKIGSNQIEYIEEFDKRLSYFWQVRDLETRSKARGMALGNYKYHWAESLLGELRLKFTQEPDDDPLLSLAARYGLCTYVCQKLQTRSISESNILDIVGSPLVVRLSYWAMHDRSLRAQHFRIIESFLQLGLKINAKSSGLRAVSGKTPWQQILYLQSQSLRSRTAQLSTMVRDNDEDQTELETSRVERLEVWTQLVELFIKFGAELDVSFKPIKEAARGRTARDLILEVMITSEIGQCLSSEESAIMEKSKIRMKQLLAEKPAMTAEINVDTNISNLPAHGYSLNNAICPSPRNIPVNEDGPVLLQHRKVRWSTSSKTTKPDGPAAPTSPTSVVTRTDQPCYRCKAVGELTGIGFELSKIFQAMEKAGVGYDVPALSAWILDQNRNTKETPPSPAINSSPSNRPKIPPSLPGQSQDSRARQWNVVAKKSNTPKKQNDIVGAQWVMKPPKGKPRRSKRGSACGAENKQENASNSSAGAIELNGGTFTWFYEPKSESQNAVTLSSEQIKRLEELVGSLGW